ncbi:glycoside hydrolase family 65 protein [Pseudoneobacillus sp. C159]
MSKVSSKEEHNWLIQEEAFNVYQTKHYEGVFTTGNGYLSIRGSHEEGLKEENQAEEYLRLPTNVTLEKSSHMLSKWGTFIPGIVGIHPLLKEVMVNLPWMLEWRIWLNDEPLHLDASNIRNYSRSLSMNDGTLKRNFIWQTNQGHELKLSYERFVSMDCDHLSVQQVKVELLKGNGKLRIVAGINGNVRTNGYNHFQTFQTSSDGEFIQTELITDKGQQVVQGALIATGHLVEWTVEEDKNHIYYETEIAAEELTSYEFRKLCAIATDRDLHGQDPLVTVRNTLLKHAPMEYDLLKNQHAKVWEQLWNNSDIKLTGIDQFQQSIRFSLYHLLRSNVRKDSRVSIDAKGHSGEAYFGRYFWDTEIFILPFFIYTNPDAAKNLVLYRYQTLKGAKLNAERYGYQGARFAWESGLTGEEQCPNWQYADHEVHITADVAYALWHYFKATDDIRFLIENGFEILVETARYWVSRVYRSPSGQYELSAVMGPDEYSPFTKNNAFTNYMVKFNLEIVIVAARIIEKREPEVYPLLKNRLNIIPEEFDQFKSVRDGLPIPKDEIRSLILQSEDFESFEDINFQEVWKDQSKPFGHYVSQEKMYRSKCLKQADVLTLMMLFPQHFCGEEMKAAYEYYEPITTHDSSLSPSTHSIIASWIGKKEEAEQFFLKTIGIDLDLPKLGAAEGIHIANAGGVWQAIVHGFSGIRNSNQSEKLELHPKLPSFAKEISFPFMWKGNRLMIRFTDERLTIENFGVNMVDIKLETQDFTVKSNSKLEIPFLNKNESLVE